MIDKRAYYIIRTYSAGVFAGNIENLEGKTAILKNVRRLWYWSGANSLSDLAYKGTEKPHDCKFTKPLEEIIVTEVIEILKCTKKAEKSIKEVREWSY